MLRTFRNLAVNIIAAFIRDKHERHKFRNKYKIKSKFRKLRDDNKILFNDNALLKQELGVIKKELELIRQKYFFRYSPNVVANCKNFYSQAMSGNLKDKYQNLISGLDSKSIECVSQIISRIKIISEKNADSVGGIDIFTEAEKVQLDTVRKEFYQQVIALSDECWAYKQYLLPTNRVGPSALYYKHQIPYLKDIKKLYGKDFMDVGCYIGNSALVFTEYTNGKIFTFEPTSINYELTLKTIEMNRCKNIIPVKLALGSRDEELEIKIYGGASTLNKAMPAYGMSDQTERITVTSLDNFVRGKDIDVGLIKVDIEGFEQEFLKGAEQTIRKHKPAMILSIYHNASDFFSIKPIIESWNLGYNFQIMHPVDGGLWGETVLICEIY